MVYAHGVSSTRARLAYFVHGHGRGHASRALSVVPALRARGYDVHLFASGEALEMLRTLGAEERALLMPGRGVLTRLLRSALQERRRLAALAPALVVSDGHQPALIAARSLALPSLAIGHDLVFTRCALPPGLSRRHLLHQRLNGLVPARLSSRRVAVHFLPIRARDPRTLVARVEGVQGAHDGPRTPHLVPYFRDDGSERVRALAQRANVPIAALDPRARLPRDAFRALLAGAAGAVGSAGSNLIAECVLLGTPLLALYRDDDAEQALNAELLARAGAGMACPFSQLGARTLARFWQRATHQEFASIPLLELPSVDSAVLRSVATLLHVDDVREGSCASR